MKQKNIFLAVSLAIAGICAVCANAFLIADKQECGLLMENVEALADSEDFVITCNSGNSGQCFAPNGEFKMCGEYFYNECVFTGYMFDYCWNPCSF